VTPNISTDKGAWKLGKGGGYIYQRIEALILEHIHAGRLKPGEPLPSYPWLSRALGVADKTVRQAYESLERQGVLEIRQGKGTFVATAKPSAGAGDRTNVLAILPPRMPFEEVDAPLFWAGARAVQTAACERRVETLFLVSGRDLSAPGSPEALADRRRYDGLIALCEVPEIFISRVSALSFPLVLLGASAPATPAEHADALLLDTTTAARELTYKLIGLGHRKLGFLREARSRFSTDAEAGYRHALGSAGIAARPSWIASVNRDLGETGAGGAAALLSEELSGVVCASEGLAVALAEGAVRRGLRIPEDLSVAAVVHGEHALIPLAGGARLEGVGWNWLEAGRRAVGRIQERLTGEPVTPVREAAPLRMLEGTSLAAPRL